MRVVGICGSLRAGSFNRALLEAAAAELPAGVEFHEWTGLETLPAYDADVDGRFAEPAVARLRRTLATADAVVIATPEYNASIPGALKNALDWASRPFPDNCLRGKPVAVIGASTGLFGAIWAQAELRKVLSTVARPCSTRSSRCLPLRPRSPRTAGFAIPRWRRRFERSCATWSTGRSHSPRD